MGLGFIMGLFFYVFGKVKIVKMIWFFVEKSEKYWGTSFSIHWLSTTYNKCQDKINQHELLQSEGTLSKSKNTINQL